MKNKLNKIALIIIAFLAICVVFLFFYPLIELNQDQSLRLNEFFVTLGLAEGEKPFKLAFGAFFIVTHALLVIGVFLVLISIYRFAKFAHHLYKLRFTHSLTRLQVLKVALREGAILSFKVLLFFAMFIAVIVLIAKNYPLLRFNNEQAYAFGELILSMGSRGSIEAFYDAYGLLLIVINGFVAVLIVLVIQQLFKLLYRRGVFKKALFYKKQS